MPKAERVPLDPDVLPWERQPDEPNATYQMFLKYRDMERRSLRGQGMNGYALTASVKWSWSHRCLEWDRYVARQEAEALIRDRISMNERQRNVSRAAQNKIAQWLLTADFDSLKPMEAARWYELAVRIEREASGANLPGAELVVPQEDGSMPEHNPLDDMPLHELLGCEPGEEQAALYAAHQKIRKARQS